MKDTYVKLAEGFELLAEGYRELAEAGDKVTEDIVPAKPPEHGITREDIRKVLAEKIDDGKMNKVRDLLLQYDAGRLSGVDSKRFPEFIKDAEAL